MNKEKRKGKIYPSGDDFTGRDHDHHSPVLLASRKKRWTRFLNHTTESRIQMQDLKNMIGERFIKEIITVSALSENVESSLKYISELKNNWDEDGALAFNEYLISEIKIFILEIEANANVVGIELPEPRVLPNHDGSIDIHYKSDLLDILLNITGEGNIVFLSFTNYGIQKMSAQTDINNVANLILSWIQTIHQ